AATNRKTKISPAPPRVFSSYRFLTHPYKKSRPPLGHAHQGSSIPCPRAPSATSGPMRRAARERDRRNSLRRNAENRKCHSEECRQHQNTCQLQGGWPAGLARLPGSRSRLTRTCCDTLAASTRRTRDGIRDRFKLTWGTRTSSIRSATPS